MKSDPRTTVAPIEKGVAYVALAESILRELVTSGSPPLIVLGLEPRADFGYDLKLRRPTLFELTAAVDDLPRVEALKP